jgi:hypothetical protein
VRAGWSIGLTDVAKGNDMTTQQKITVGFGILYLLIGLLGFVPGITVPTDQPGQGLLLGIFAVNTIHNLIHLAAGAVLVWGGLTPSFISTVNKVMAVVFLLLVPLSLIAPIAEGVAINGPDTLLPLVSALLTGYLGFIAGRDRVRTA